MANSTANVSIGKGVQGGYAYAADAGTTLPTDYSTDLDSDAFECLGYISEDGITEATDEDATEVVDMNGDTVLTETGTHTKTFEFSAIETKKATLKEYFGDDCVEDADGTITVKEQSGKRVSKVYVFDLVLSGDRRARIVVPDGKVTEVGEIVYSSGEVVGYDMTITAYPDEDGVKTVRYIQSTETEAA